MPTPAAVNLAFLFRLTPPEFKRLSANDLVAFILGRNTDDTLCIQVSAVLQAATEDIEEAPWGQKAGLRILAALELGRRAAHDAMAAQPALQGPADLVALARRKARPDAFGGWGFALDADLRVLRMYRVGPLATNALAATLRTWLRPGLACEAHYIAFAFPVSDGGLVPSPDEIHRLQRLAQHASLMGTPLLDCVRWNETGFHSCSTMGWLSQSPAERESEKSPLRRRSQQATQCNNDNRSTR